MRLQTRLFLAFALSVTVPLAATAIITRRTIRQEFSDYYNARLEQTNDAVRLVYSDLVRDQENRLGSLCGGDPFLDAALVEIARPQPSPQLRSRLQAWVGRQAEALNVDTLDVLGQQGLVLASAHYPGRRGEGAGRLQTLARRADGRAVIAPITRRAEGGGEHDSLTLLTACRASQAGEEIWLLGGLLVDETLAELIASRLGLDDVVVAVLDHNPVDLGAPQPDRAGPVRRVLPLVNRDDDTTPAWLVITVDDSRERRAQQKLDRSTLLIIAVAIALSWLLGMLVSRTIGRPLGRLADQARVVSAGELGGQVTVRASGEVRDLVDAFNTMSVGLKDSRDRLVQAERIAAWRDIARRIAHEIKNPLFPIQTSIETMRKAYRKEHPDFEEIFEESTVMILEEVERLKRIVTEFSRFARLPKPAPEPLELAELVGNMMSLYSGQDVEVDNAIPADLPAINADREQLTQVFHNLIQNAIDATRERGPTEPRIEVSAEVQGEGVIVVVRDNGIGIDEDRRAKIFEPYFTTKEGRGTGLGLAIVHRIITDHGGTISVESSPGRGSTFRLYLTAEGPPPPRPSIQPEA